MSYQARMLIPPLMVTGRTGACGRTKRSARSPVRTSSGTTLSKSWPSAPKPCIQMTVLRGCGPVSISMLSRSFICIHFAAHEQYFVRRLRLLQVGRQVKTVLEEHAERHEDGVVPPHRTVAMMREPPHPKLEQARGARLHAKYGAALGDEPMLGEPRAQLLRRVAAFMTDEIVEWCPA